METDELLKRFKNILDNKNEKDNADVSNGINIINLINSIQSSNVNPSEDKVINTKLEGESTLRILERMVPYFDKDNQKNIVLFLKLNEISNVMKKYEKVELQSTPSDKNWKKGLLTAIKPELSPDNRGMVDMAIKFIEYKEIFKVT